MSRSFACVVLGCLALLPVGVASATPTVKFKAQAVPIPGFPHTGNILGAGTAIAAEYQIGGTEYVGSPPPIMGVNVYFPSGTKLHPTGFPTCSRAVLEQVGPSGCKKGSAAGPIGKAEGFVSFGGERVEEDAELFSFYSPEGGLELFADGHTPASLEILSSGRYAHLNGGGGYGPELITTVPLIPSVPGAPFASVKSIKVEGGSAYKSHGKTIYYGRLPSKCPKGGFPLKTEVIFAEEGDEAKPIAVTASYSAPCPKK
jgi:hypothetical protein